MSCSTFIALSLFLLSEFPHSAVVAAERKLRGDNNDESRRRARALRPPVENDNFLDPFQERLLQQHLQALNGQLGYVDVDILKEPIGDADDTAQARDLAFAKHIANGYEAETEIRYFCITMKKINGGYYPGNCGASLIGDEYAITAAHCISNAAKDDQISNMGALYCNAHSPYARNNEFPYQLIDIAEIIQHPDHIPRTASPYDVAILKLAKPANVYIQRLKIATESYMSNCVGNGDKLTVTGMGMNSSGRSSRVVKQAHVPLVNWSTCENTMFKWGLDDTMMCAGGDGNADACLGDSGGPLVSKDGYLVGIVSWGYSPCNIKGYPGVYANVSRFEGWIRIVTGNSSSIKFMTASGLDCGTSDNAISNTVAATTSTKTEEATTSTRTEEAMTSTKIEKATAEMSCKDDNGKIHYLDSKNKIQKTTCKKVSEKPEKMCKIKILPYSDDTFTKRCPVVCSACP